VPRSGGGAGYDCFAQCAPGLEDLVAAELRQLGIHPGRRDPGGVAFRASTRQLYAANLWLRTASRVLVRRASFRATSFAELQLAAEALEWDRWFGPETRLVFRVSTTRSRLYHTDAVAERLLRVTGAGPGDGPEQLVTVRLVADQVTVSFDSSGDRLHRRGWRLETAKAPLRETLAAAMVAASGWDGQSPLVDPMCGSGTIAIEAALAARQVAPGVDRVFAFQRWPGFEPGTWASVTGEARARVRPPGSGPPILAADRDPGAIAATRANAERAGVIDDVDIRQAALSTLTARPGWPPGLVLTNPPYGARVRGGSDLRDLYAAFGQLLRGRLAGWRAGLLVTGPVLAAQTGLDLEERLRTTNGGIPVRLLLSRV
jgi:putative N6-adenine-specific DNA methylase